MISLESYCFCRYRSSLKKSVLIIFCLFEYIYNIYNICIYIVYIYICVGGLRNVYHQSNQYSYPNIETNIFETRFLKRAASWEVHF